MRVWYKNPGFARCLTTTVASSTQRGSSTPFLILSLYHLFVFVESTLTPTMKLSIVYAALALIPTALAQGVTLFTPSVFLINRRPTPTDQENLQQEQCRAVHSRPDHLDWRNW